VKTIAMIALVATMATVPNAKASKHFYHLHHRAISHCKTTWPRTERRQCIGRFVARSFGISFDSMNRIVTCESTWNPHEVMSSSGAAGLAQFLPSTWSHLPRPISRHSVFESAWNLIGMAWLRTVDGDYHEWTCSYLTGAYR
jgi:hypothetical protein